MAISGLQGQYRSNTQQKKKAWSPKVAQAADSNYFGPGVESTQNYTGRFSGGQPNWDWSSATSGIPRNTGDFAARETAGGGMMETPFGNVQAQNWGERLLGSVASQDATSIEGHSQRLSTLAEKIKADYAEQQDKAMNIVNQNEYDMDNLFRTEREGIDSTMQKLDDLMSGRTPVSTLPQFSGMADYLEKAIGRQQSAEGYNMSGNMAHAVAGGLQQFGNEAYNDQMQGYLAQLGQLGQYRNPYVTALTNQGRNTLDAQQAFMYPSDLYANLMASSSELEAQKHGGWADVAGFMANQANVKGRKSNPNQFNWS